MKITAKNTGIRKSKVKFGIAIILVLLATVISLFSLRELSRFVVSFQQGANLADALNLVGEIQPELSAELEWLADDPDTAQPMELYMRDLITSDYMAAWQGLRMAYLLPHEVDNLRTYFTGSAYQQTLKAVSDATEAGYLIRQKDYNHNLKLHFYAPNRSVVSFTDQNFTLVRLIREGEAGEILDITEEQLTADVVMFYNEGYWQIRNLHVTGMTLPNQPSADPPTDQFITAQGNQLYRRGQIFKVRGFNYYPQDYPWYKFWPNFDPDIIAADLETMRGLGSNTVRIFIPFDQWGFNPVDKTYLNNLETFLDLAEANQMFVIVTLFDRRTDYDIETWAAADAHLEQIIPRFANHPAILAWDVKNEADKDYNRFAEREEVLAWLRHTTALIRVLDNNHLLTAGWFSPEMAADTAPYVDFISFHYFDYPEKLPPLVTQLQTSFPNKPLLLEEFGAHTRYGLHLDAHTEAEQAYYYGQMFQIVHNFDLAGALAWTLYDFPDVLLSLGKKGDSVENHLGLIRIDGSLKPAVSQFIPNGELNVPPPSFLSRFNKPLYRLLSGLAVGIAIIVAIIWIWLKFSEYLRFGFSLLGKFIRGAIKMVWRVLTWPWRWLRQRF